VRGTDLRIALESVDQPEVIALIDALDAYQMPLYPLESHHGIDIEALRQPGVLFAVARDAGGRAMGCGAVVLASAQGELKRMYVDPACRGRGIGRALLAFLEREAVVRGCRVLALETGYLQQEAIGLYESAGFVRCGTFGDYIDDPNSVFLSKEMPA
jgi:putative acetyltransferase